MRSQTLHRSNVEDIYPLSALQEGMLFHTLYAPEERPYLDHIVWELRDGQGLDVAALNRAFRELVMRHEALRTAFTWKVGKRSHQVVLRQAEIAIEEQDWRGLARVERAQRLNSLLEADRARGYDLSRPPLIRLMLLRLETTIYQLVFSYHHIIMDAWSVPIVFKEWKAFYESFTRGHTLELPQPRPYRAYIDWLTQQRLSDAEAFWLRELEAFTGPTPVIYDRQASISTQIGKDYNDFQIELGQPTTSALQSLARQHGLTMNTLIQGAWALLISYYANTTDVVFGTVVSGRPHELPGMESMVGLFTNTLPMRVRIEPHRPLLPWLADLQTRQFRLRQYEWSPLAKLQEWTRMPAGTPLFESIVIFQNVPSAAASTQHQEHWLDMRVVRHDPKNNFPLTLMVFPGRSVSLRMLYDCRRFEDDTVLRSLGHLKALLERLVDFTNQPLAEIDFLMPAEKHQVLVECNDSEFSFPNDLCAHGQFELQALQTPDAVAASAGKGWLTYAELNRCADRLARLLLERSPGPEGIVALFGERDLNFLTAMLAIFKADCGYLPLDPRHPQQRLLSIIELSKPALILTQKVLLSTILEAIEDLPTARRPRVLVIETLLKYKRAEGTLPRRASLDSLAYVIFTSGSTGVPKGSMIEHRGMLNHLYAKIAELHIGKEDAIAQTAAQSFDISIWQFLAGLLVGAQVHILGNDVAHDPALLLDKIETLRLSILECVPSMLRLFLDEIMARGPSNLPLASLTCLLATGEALPPYLCREWLGEYPGIPLLNAYGPTECSDDVTHHWITEPPHDEATRIPIGRPVANMRLYVLNQWLPLKPVLTAGEMCIAGVGVGRGYLSDPTRTAEAFVPNPFPQQPGERIYRTGDLTRRLTGGNLDFLGRIDYQVKIRGYRIELGEIETIIRRHPGVLDVMVIAREGESLGVDTRLTAYVIPDPDFREAGEASPALADTDRDRVADWQMIFDEVYRQEIVSGQDPSLHLRVWINSYTGQPFTEEEIFECVEDSVQHILSLKPSRVLEVGCGPGLLLHRVAPSCEAYYGTDISNEALVALQKRLESDKKLPVEWRLLHRSAEDFDGLEPESFDVITLNEVVQYFPNVEYLVKVLEGAGRVVRPGGFIFVGGLRNLLLLDAFHASVQLFQAPASLTMEELEQRVQARAAREKELAIAPEFFLALQQRFQEITRLWLIPKGGRFLNEFTKFRYDAILEIRGERASEASCPHVIWHNQQWSASLLQDQLSASHPQCVAMTAVPNAGVLPDVKALELLRGETQLKTAGELREFLAEWRTQVRGVHPQQMKEWAQAVGYDSDISWANTDQTGRYDAFLIKHEDGGSCRSTASQPRRSISRQPWSRYANSPQGNQSIANLAPNLRRNLKGSLPDYMMPSEFVMLPAFPLTPNGKVDRRALLAMKSHEAIASESTRATRTPTEELLIAMWSEILGAQVGPNSNFFESGGNSLLATASIARVRKVFKVELQLRSLFDAPTVAGFSRKIDVAVKERQGLTAPPITRAPETDRKPLSFAQQRLWVVHQMGSEDWAYNLPTALRIDGLFQTEAFHAALNEITRRHEVLRTTFDGDGNEPFQIICPPARIRLAVIDLSQLTEEEMEAESRRLAFEESHRSIDLKNGPLLRVHRLKWSHRTNIILATMHHIVSDGWSAGLLVSEMTSLYNAYKLGEPSGLPELPIQYADFAHWQRDWLQGEVLQKQLAYWKAELSGAPFGLQLPLDKPRSLAQGASGLSYSFSISNDSSKAIKTVCRKEAATVFMAMFGALSIFLYKTSDQSDIVIGTDIANRNWKEVEDLIGFFVNLLPLRVKLSGRSTFREVLARVRDVAVGAYAHQDLPFDLLTKELRLESGLSQYRLFDVLFVFQNFPGGSLQMPDAELSLIPIEYGVARFDLTLFLEETPQGLTGRWTCRNGLFEPATLARLSSRFVSLTDAMLEWPDAPLDDLDFINPFEKIEKDRLQKMSFDKFKNLGPKALSLPR